MHNELTFIAALRQIAIHPAARGLNDDCAVLEVGGEPLVLTHDMMVEGVHFLPGQDPADVAWRLVATNMSDLAAKGAAPLGVLLGYQLAEDDARFLLGLKEALAHYNAPLLGGDTVGKAQRQSPQSPQSPQSLGLTAIGRATHRPVPSRAEARVGDALWITGPVGAAMIAFEAYQRFVAAPFANAATETLAYRRPRALLAEGQALAPLVTAMMDVSDGLLLDATRMALASGVTLAIDSAAVPIAAPEARRAEALRWGDDYQLLFTLPHAAQPPVPAHRIGTALAKGASPLLLDGTSPAEGDPLGYRH